MRDPSGAQAGGEDFETLYRDCYKAIFAYVARRIEGDPETVADLAAEAFVVALRKRDAIPPPPGDRLWLFGVARRVVLDHQQRHKRQARLKSQLRAQAALSEAGTDQGELSRLRVQQAIQQLKPAHREVLAPGRLGWPVPRGSRARAGLYSQRGRPAPAQGQSQPSAHPVGARHAGTQARTRSVPVPAQRLREPDRLDQLIQDADPVANITIPGHDSPLARWSFETALAGPPGRKPARQRRFVVPFSATAVAAAAAGVTLFVTVTPGVPTASAAAAVLSQAADAAARQQPVILHPGEYLYTETRSLSDGFDEVNNKVFDPEYVETDQSWLTQQGAGKDISTVVSPVTFANGTRRLWIEAGRPKIYQSSPFVSFYKAPKPGSGPEEPVNTGVPLENLSHLPTDPAALTQAIESKTGLASVNADPTPSSPSAIFYTAMAILSEQSVGGTPALRSALFKVMAQQPGIMSLGPARTRSGRPGIGLQTPPDHGAVFKVIVDPATGQILESDTYVNGVAGQWTEYLSTAVVKKIGQVPQS